MNFKLFILICCSMLFLLASCGKKKETNVIIVDKPVKEQPKGPQQMKGIAGKKSPVEWLGKTYYVVINRTSDKSLAMSKDENGHAYYDNKITVKISREDGSVFFERTFTKSDFEEYLDANTRQNGALLGIALNKAEGDNLMFAASVGSPDELSDLYVPLVLTVSRMGVISIKKDVQLDISGEEEEEM